MLVKPFEGCAKKIPDGMLEAYPDPASPLVTSRQYKYPYTNIPYEELVELGRPWTIGYGATGKGIGPGTVWTLEQAETALDEHLIEFLVPLLKMFHHMSRKIQEILTQSNSEVLRTSLKDSCLTCINLLIWSLFVFQSGHENSITTYSFLCFFN